MRVLVALENHFERGPNNHIYADGPPNYAFWSRYLDVFEEVIVLARVRDTAVARGEQERSDGPGVSFAALPDYRGPWHYLRCLPALQRCVRDTVSAADAYILRVPGLVGRLVWFELRRRRKPYALDVIGDPWEAFGKGTWRSIFRPVFQQVASHNLRAMCRDATAARYVTRRVLPQRYPAAPAAFVTSFSDVELQKGFAAPDALAARSERIRARENMGDLRPRHIGFIGSFAQLYKAPDVLLEALAECARRGLAFEASFVGDGRFRRDMETLSRRLGLECRVRFLGVLPYGKAVQEFLDSVDLFVMPSRTEGLPRAMVEAMARGCPCIGSAVGGIPELLREEDLVAPNDPQALAEKIAAILGDPQRLQELSRRNFEKAQEFRSEILDEGRREFYRAVRDRATPRGVR
ncbi:MAG: glycosyltransferase family 4 protein [Acidipila sp.]|nr:glycosyltransferase family 4 protein [Acidipila sp.]